LTQNTSSSNCMSGPKSEEGADPDRRGRRLWSAATCRRFRFADASPRMPGRGPSLGSGPAVNPKRCRVPAVQTQGSRLLARVDRGCPMPDSGPTDHGIHDTNAG
jgi:hypothetical protein